jgi:hypothetical protein
MDIGRLVLPLAVFLSPAVGKVEWVSPPAKRLTAPRGAETIAPGPARKNAKTLAFISIALVRQQIWLTQRNATPARPNTGSVPG